MDRGFCSADNINALYKDHYKFLLGASTTLKYARDFIREIGDTKEHFEFYDSDFDLYVFSKTCMPSARLLPGIMSNRDCTRAILSMRTAVCTCISTTIPRNRSMMRRTSTAGCCSIVKRYYPVIPCRNIIRSTGSTSRSRRLLSAASPSIGRKPNSPSAYNWIP